MIFFIIPSKIDSLSFCSDRFYSENDKKDFFHIFYLSFDERFAKEYHFSLHYRKTSDKKKPKSVSCFLNMSFTEIP